MNGYKTLAVALLTLLPTTASALSIEIASQAAPQSTAPQKWLQLLAKLGETNVRIRGAKAGDRPRLESRAVPGHRERPKHAVVGDDRAHFTAHFTVKLHAILTRRNELILPQGRFTLRDQPKLAAYLKRLRTEGPEGITAARGKFGLTEKQFTALFAFLTPPLGKHPAGATLRQLLPDSVQCDVAGTLQTEAEGHAEVESLSLGTALAVMLRQEGLALRAIKPIGQPVELHVVRALSQGDTWPVGYKPEQTPSETFPQLFEKINVEVTGYSLQEALDAIGQQLPGLPLVWDRFVLRRDAIDPASIQVRLPSTRTYYKRILDRLLFQARLKGELRIDEAGQPFLWITR